MAASTTKKTKTNTKKLDFTYLWKGKTIKAIHPDTADTGFFLDMADAEEKGDLAMMKFIVTSIVLPDYMETARKMKPTELGRFLQEWNNLSENNMGK